MKDRRYKPGQLVTIDGRVFRIIDGNKQKVLYNGYFTCRKCFDGNNGVNICDARIWSPKWGPINYGPIYNFCCDLSYGYYLKRIL